MSSTNRGAERRQDDAYATPPWAVHRLLDARPTLVDWLPRNGGDEPVWLEPSCGDGAIIAAVGSWTRAHGYSRGPSWAAIDVRDCAAAFAGSPGVSFRQADFLTVKLGHRVDAAIGNPPFSLAEEFVRACIAATDGPVVLLTRLGFLASGRRAGLMRELRPSVFVLPDRPSFTGNGTDSADYCWLEFPPADERGKVPGHVEVLATTPLSERRAQIEARP